MDIMADDGVMTKEEQHYWVPTFAEMIAANKDPKFLEPDFLLTVKASHSNWNVHWGKTMHDILFLKRKGAKINEDIYKKLVKDWKKVHGRESTPLKDRTADQFFDDAVNRKYVHDDIHEAVAFGDEPLYKKILKEEGKVDCCKKKFDNLEFCDKVKLIKEEIFVTALERWVIPNDYEYSAGRAYNAALKKFVTTMSSGWISFWMIDNFESIMRADYDYVEAFKKNEQNCRLETK